METCFKSLIGDIVGLKKPTEVPYCTIHCQNDPAYWKKRLIAVSQDLFMILHRGKVYYEYWIAILYTYNKKIKLLKPDISELCLSFS